MKKKSIFILLSLILLFINCRKISYEMPPYPKQTKSFSIKKQLYNLNLFDAIFHIHYTKNHDSTWIEIKNLDHQYGMVKFIVEYSAEENTFNYDNTLLITKTIIGERDTTKSIIIPITLPHNSPFTENNFKVYVTNIENFENHTLAGLYQSISSQFSTNHDSTTLLAENYTIIESNGITIIRLKANNELYNSGYHSLKQSSFSYENEFIGSLYNNNQLSYDLTIIDTNNIRLSNNRLMLKYNLTSSNPQSFHFLSTHLQKL